MAHQQSNPDREPLLRHLLRDDLRRRDIRQSVERDFDDLKEFYLTPKRKARLATMGWLKHWFYMTGWLVKSLLLKLTPVRRLLLFLAFLFLIVSGSYTTEGDATYQFNTQVLAAIMILFVLMLELKDKLIARSELEAGRKVQYSLMPEKTPEVPGWSLWLYSRPANEVGGDLVDYLKISTHRHAVSLADVAGKGLSAALLMAKLQATIRALASDQRSLVSFGETLNRIFYRDRVPQMFASLVYAELDPDSRSIRILNAGHLPPLIKRGSVVEELSKGGPALGILPDAAFEEHGCELAAGEFCVVYSDGLTEAQDGAGEFFGTQRFLDLLRTVDGANALVIGEKIVQSVDRFVGEARASDDLSLVILQRMV